MTKPHLTDALKAEITKMYDKYEVRRSVIMPALHAIQESFGYISKEVADELSGFMELPRVMIEEVITFYTMYHRNPVGKHHFQVCENVTCCMFQARELTDHIKKLTNLKKPGEVTEDGLFSYEAVACLGSCGTAPVVMINDDYHESFSEEKATMFVENARGSKDE